MLWRLIIFGGGVLFHSPKGFLYRIDMHKGCLKKGSNFESSLIPWKMAADMHHDYVIFMLISSSFYWIYWMWLNILSIECDESFHKFITGESGIYVHGIYLPACGYKAILIKLCNHFWNVWCEFLILLCCKHELQTLQWSIGSRIIASTAKRAYSKLRGVIFSHMIWSLQFFLVFWKRSVWEI